MFNFFKKPDYQKKIYEIIQSLDNCFKEIKEIREKIEKQEIRALEEKTAYKRKMKKIVGELDEGEEKKDTRDSVLIPEQ